MYPKKPVVLVHAISLDHQNWNLPDKQARLHVEAACKLYQQYEVSKIFFAGGEYRKGKKLMGDVMAAYAIKILGKDKKNDIISVPKATTTRTEIRIFKEQTQKNSWNNLLDISTRSHLVRIKRRLVIEFEREVPTLSAEEILGKTSAQPGIFLRESLLNKIDGSPLGGMFDWVSQKIPNKCYLEEVVTEFIGRLRGNS